MSDHTPVVRLGRIEQDTVAPAIYVLVEAGVRRDPQLARSIEGSVLLALDFTPPVGIDFRGSEIHVADVEHPGPADLVVHGRLQDVVALVSAPLRGGVPNPLSAAGRGALYRLADGRVELFGPVALGRKVLQLLAIVAERA